MPSRVMSMRSAARNALPFKANITRGNRCEPGNRHQRRSFTRTIRTDDRRDIALPDFEIDALQRLDMTIRDFETLYAKHRLRPRETLSNAQIGL